MELEIYVEFKYCFGCKVERLNFLKCWNLENLRPLEAFENIHKGNEIIKTENNIDLQENDLKSA